MTLALILFAFTYCLMLALPRFRPFAALGGAGAFLLLGQLAPLNVNLHKTRP